MHRVADLVALQPEPGGPHRTGDRVLLDGGAADRGPLAGLGRPTWTERSVKFTDPSDHARRSVLNCFRDGQSPSVMPAGVLELGGPVGIQDLPHHHPVTRPVLVEAAGIDQGVEAATDARRGRRRPAPRTGSRASAPPRSGGHRSSASGRSPATAAGRRRARCVVQVAVDDAPGAVRVSHQIGGHRGRLLHQPVRHRAVDRQPLQLGRPSARRTPSRGAAVAAPARAGRPRARPPPRTPRCPTRR